MNKILLVVCDTNERTFIEESIYDIVRDGGTELFFAPTLENGRAIIERENPQLIFIDYSFKEEIKKPQKGTMIFICNEDVSEQNILKRPLCKEQILEICYHLLDFTDTIHKTMLI